MARGAGDVDGTMGGGGSPASTGGRALRDGALARSGSSLGAPRGNAFYGVRVAGGSEERSLWAGKGGRGCECPSGITGILLGTCRAGAALPGRREIPHPNLTPPNDCCLQATRRTGAGRRVSPASWVQQGEAGPRREISVLETFVLR